MEPIYHTITHNVVAVRVEPHPRSEMATQAILGMPVRELDAGVDYLRVQTPDGYAGWLPRRHTRRNAPGAPYDESAWPPTHEESVCVAAPFAEVYAGSASAPGILTRIVFGTWLRAADRDGDARDGYMRVLLPTAAEEPALTTPAFVNNLHLSSASGAAAFHGEAVATLSTQFLGTPYLWGGTTPFGFDCSGFVQAVFRHFGVFLPRDAYQQLDSASLEPIPEGRPLEAGDLVFFRGADDRHERGVSHVAIGIDAARVIHASGQDGVAIDQLGDLVRSRGYALRGVRRVPTPGGSSRPNR